MRSGATERARRGRGERAGLSIPIIVEAARALPAGDVTMQAVADRLGVDRKALSNHVADREDLLERVAADAVSDHLASVGVAGGDSWQEVCRAYARGLAEAVIEIGELSRHFRWDTPHPALLALAEHALGHLVVAGFDDETAARALSMLTTLSIGYAQNRMAAAREADAPLAARLRRSFAASDEGAFRNLSRITESTIRTYDPEQLELMIDIFVSGLERKERSRQGAS